MKNSLEDSYPQFQWEETEKFFMVQMKSQGQADISDATLLKVAKEKAEELNIKPFSGSGGWLSNFKHRQACPSFLRRHFSSSSSESSPPSISPFGL